MKTKAIVIFDLTVILKLAGYSSAKFKIERLLTTEFYSKAGCYDDVLICDIGHTDLYRTCRGLLDALQLRMKGSFCNSDIHVKKEEILEKDLYFIHYDGLNTSYYSIKFKGEK